MHRRGFLQAGIGVVGAGVLSGAVGGNATASSDQHAFEPLGSVAVQGATEAVVHHDDEIAYVATEDGFAAVDITTAESPAVIAERRDIDTGGERSLDLAWDLWAWEDRLVVGGPAQPTASAHGFALFDISDPAAPEQVAFYDTGRPGTEGGHRIHNLDFDDGIVYLTGTGTSTHPVVMVDVSDDDPEEVGRWSILDYEPAYGEVPLPMRVLHDVYVQDGIAYLPYWDSGTWIVDVSDSSDPAVLSQVGEYGLDELREFEDTDAQVEAFVPPGNAHYTTVNDEGTLLAVGKEAWATPSGEIGGAGGVDLYDVSDPSAPRHLALIEAPESFGQSQSEWFTTAHNCDFAGERLYTSWYFGGVKVHDVSDPANPDEIAWWRDPREASFWTAQSAGDVFVGSSTNTARKISDDLNETPGALYVFPDRAGEQSDPPSLTDPPEGYFDSVSGSDNSNGTAGEDNEDDTEGTDGAENAADDDGSDGGESTADQSDDEETNSVDSNGPGLGVGTAIAGIGGYYLLDEYRTDEE